MAIVHGFTKRMDVIKIQVSLVLTIEKISLTMLCILCTRTRVYESFSDFTGQSVWWTGKNCLTNHDFTRPTHMGKNGKKKTILQFVSLKCNIIYKD